MNDEHSKYHSSDAFCGFAGPEEMQHLTDLIKQLTDDELRLLTANVGISFGRNDNDRRGMRKAATKSGT